MGAGSPKCLNCLVSWHTVQLAKRLSQKRKHSRFASLPTGSIKGNRFRN